MSFTHPAPRSLTGLRMLRLWATHYHVFQAPAIPANRDGVELLGARNTPLGVRLTKRDYCLGSIEGTLAVRFPDGTCSTYNFLDAKADPELCDCTVFGSKISRKTGKVRYRPANGPFGDGVKNFILVPFRTIAVDPQVIPYRTALFIPDAVGVRLTLPDGTEAIHDGYFFAADTGGAIKGTHIDVFQGFLSSRPFAPFIASKPTRSFTAHIVRDPAIIQSLRAAHTPTAAPNDSSSPLVIASGEIEASAPIIDTLQWLQSGSSGPLVRVWQSFLAGQGHDPKGIDRPPHIKTDIHISFSKHSFSFVSSFLHRRSSPDREGSIKPFPCFKPSALLYLLCILLPQAKHIPPKANLLLSHKFFVGRGTNTRISRNHQESRVRFHIFRGALVFGTSSVNPSAFPLA